MPTPTSLWTLRVESQAQLQTLHQLTVHQDHKVHKVSRAKQDQQDLREIQDRKVPKDPKVLKVLKVIKVHKAYKDLKETLATWVRKDQLDQLVRLDLKATRLGFATHSALRQLMPIQDQGSSATTMPLLRT